MKTSILATWIAALLIVPAVSLAAEGRIGDPAPPLKIAEWIKGKPVNLAELKGKKIAVIEFWATWCGPCRQSIPHLTELQKKFPDVVIVGISDEKVETVRSFVQRMGDKMDYVVAVDQDEQTGKAYMEAFGIDGIPHAFVVDKEGRIVWHGHPMDQLDKVLDELQTGKFDLTKARKQAEARAKLEAFAQAVLTGDDAKANALGKELEAADAEVGPLLGDRKFQADEIRKLIQFRMALAEYQEALLRDAPDETLGQLEKRLAASAPKEFDLESYKQRLANARLFNQYARAASRNATNELPALAQKLRETKGATAEDYNEWAWTLLTDERIQQRDLDLAMHLAQAALDASGGTNASILDTYARALFDTGKVREAIHYQKKAIAAAEDESLREMFREVLSQYEAAARTNTLTR
ncbi:MAG: redoxin domain-containing protein [Verrucomicrobiota bacterium]|nr:redoxin domain-containing protein [Limisphaera sp.]MDW8383066.1 redoxin domain-containing protein [Verrucomicrobiota bacterium]